MKLMTERGQILGVAERWADQYGGEKGEIHAALVALNKETATADDVKQIIGNGSWVMKPACDECDIETWDVVQMGEPPDYESRTVYLCAGCLKKAIDLLKTT